MSVVSAIHRDIERQLPKRLDGGERAGTKYGVAWKDDGPKQFSAFEIGKPDEHRETFEAFGRRVAMHLERRDVSQAVCVLQEAARFIHELDHPEQIAVHDLPIAAVIPDVRTVNMLDGLGITSVRELTAKSPVALLQVGNCGEKTVEQIRGCLAAVGVEWGTVDEVATAVEEKQIERKQAGNVISADCRERRKRRQFQELKNFLRRRGPTTYDGIREAFDWPEKVVKWLLATGHFAPVTVRGKECWALIRE
jgi:hypothetical protein